MIKPVTMSTLAPGSWSLSNISLQKDQGLLGRMADSKSGTGNI